MGYSIKNNLDYSSQNLAFEYQNLPTKLSLMAVQGAILLPRSQLPIPVNDLDHLVMAIESLRTHQLIGVVQPISVEDITAETSPIFKTGCAGKILDLNEIDEGRFLITLKGICRFKIIEEFKTKEVYREALVSYEDYTLDCVEDNDFSFDRPRLLKALENYFRVVDITPNWQEIAKTSNEKLIAALTMVCPLEAREKQAVLEAPTPKEQSQLITTMIELATQEGISSTCH
jgi:Lon protease-like protein